MASPLPGNDAGSSGEEATCKYCGEAEDHSPGEPGSTSTRRRRRRRLAHMRLTRRCIHERSFLQMVAWSIHAAAPPPYTTGV